MLNQFKYGVAKITETPVYGRVYISINPVAGATLTRSKLKHLLLTQLKDFNIASITPIIEDPETTKLVFNQL